MDFARSQKLIAVSPADGCALPKLEHQEMETLPVEQLASFLREAKESGVFEMYYIELATGLRRGELLGLKWEDLDLDRDTLRVQLSPDSVLQVLYRGLKRAGLPKVRFHDLRHTFATAAQREAAKTMSSVLSGAFRP